MWVMGGNMRTRRGYGREYEDKKGLCMGGNMRTRGGYGREYVDKNEVMGGQEGVMGGNIYYAS